MSESYETMSVAEIQAIIEKTSKILEEFTETFNAETENLTSVNKELQPIIEKYRELLAKKKPIEEMLKDLKPKVQQTRSYLDDLKHWLSRAKLRELEIEELQKLSSELDTLTANMPWREWAYSHQIEGAKRIALTKGRAILGDKRGLGKTLTSLIACDMLKSKKIIIFAPKETIKNFEEEIKIWAPHRSLVSMISQPRDIRTFVLDGLKLSDQFILTVNLEAWRRDPNFIKQLIALKAHTVIIDEAHYIKESKTTMAKGVRQVVQAQNQCALCGENDLALSSDARNMICLTDGCDAVYKVKDPNCMSVKHVIPMTGTLILNTPEDLWTLLNLIDEPNFRKKEEFLTRYCVLDFSGKWRFRSGGEATLVKKLGPSLIQRDRYSAGVKIPPQKIQFYELDFDKEKYPYQYKAYKELQERWMIFSNNNPDEIMTVNYAITHLLRLRQMMVWPEGIHWKDSATKQTIFKCDVAESIKLDMAVDLAKEFIEEGERVVLFSQFTAPILELAKRLSKTPVATEGDRLIRPCLLYGATSDKERAHIRYDFDVKNNSDDYDIVLAHYRVGGQSLNFTKASQMIITDEEWNPGKNDQAYGRIDRLGQTKETTVHIPIVNGTVDSFMRDLNEYKQKLIDGLEGQINLAARMREAIEKGEM